MTTILYFSPTGNARYLAGKLAASLGAETTELLALEFTTPENLAKRDELIILYSIHAFNPPRTVRRFVKQIPAGLFDTVGLIGVGCGDSWVNRAASSGLRKSLEKKGYSVSLDEIAAMPLTFIVAFPNETVEKLIISADEKIIRFAQTLKKREIHAKRISLWSYLIHFIGKA
ncbi:MAG: flavodoxin family protein, partial [Spirochaetales bacterium]|nr:flavodoxin family protein [Spirochaetales bacterium]